MRQPTKARFRLYVALGAGAMLLHVGAFALVKAEGTPEQKILFVSNRAGGMKFNIYAMNSDGSGQAALTKGDGIEMDPTWSPDGKQIAFSAFANPKEPKAELWTMNADGSRRKQLTKLKLMATAPAWSPDGKQIAFSTMSFGEKSNVSAPPKFKLYTIDADGSNLKAIGDGLLPTWSPDGKKILASALGENTFDLTLMDIDGKNGKPLTGNNKAMMGTWSPDGKRIVYLGEGGGNEPDIFVMNADGSGAMQLTKTDEMEFCPQWTPDGKHILFVRLPKDFNPGPGANNTPKMQIFVMDADGKNVKQLTDDKNMNLLHGGSFVLGLLTVAQVGPVQEEVKKK